MKSYGSTPAALPQYSVKRNEIIPRTERDLLQADRPGYGSRNKLEVAFNLVNATVGAGIIGLPFAIYNAGFVFGIVVSILVAIVSQLGLYMLIVAGQRVGVYKFAGLVEYLMGRPGYHFLNIIMLVQTLGVCVSYFILLGDTLPVLLTLYFPQYEIFQNRSLVVAAISLVLVFPLNLPRSIGALARWSIVSVLCIPVIIVILLIRAPQYIPDPYDIPITTVGPNVFGALGILAFAFACPHVAFNNFLSQADQTSRGWASSTIIATTMSWSVSIPFAVVGYLCFGPNLEPNVFRNFPPDDNIVNIGRFALGFSMILTIPMAFLPTREAVQKILGFETPTRQPTATQHYAVTAVLFLVVMYIGITVQSLGKVYALVGGFAATTLAYIIPAVAYLVTSRLRRPSKGKEPATPSTIDDEETLLNQEDAICLESPSCWSLDAAACFLVVWGFVVMFLAAFSVCSFP